MIHQLEIGKDHYFYKDKNGFVRSVQLYTGNSESNALVSCVSVRQISNIVLLVESNKEVQSLMGET